MSDILLRNYNCTKRSNESQQKNPNKGLFFDVF